MKNFLLSSPEKFWRYFSSKKKSISSILVNGKTVADRFNIATSFNDFFCSLFTKGDTNMPLFIQYVNIPPISEVSISWEGVLSLLLQIVSEKTSGIDSTDNSLVRYAKRSSQYLLLIFNKSLSQSQIPHPV